MEDDDLRSHVDEETKMFEAPRELLERRKRGATNSMSSSTTKFDRSSSDSSSQSSSEVEPETTMALDWVDEIRSRADNNSGENGAGSTKETGESGQERVSVESTMLLDIEGLCAGADEFQAKKDSQEPTDVDVVLLDERRAQFFDWQGLEAISGEQRCGLDDLFDVLPVSFGSGSIAAQLEDRLQKVVGRPHHVQWQTAAPGLSADQWQKNDDDFWTWGRMPPGHQRFAVAVDRRLARGWVSTVGSDTGVSGDDFEFGIITFIVAEYCGALCKAARWPSWSWAVNPIERSDLETIFRTEKSQHLQLSFQVEFEDGVGSLRIVLPAALLRRLRQERPRSDSSDWEAKKAWWGGLRICRPVVAGVTMLRCAELEQISVGDVVIVDRHGVESGQATESAVEGGARWLFSDGASVTGTLRNQHDGSWRFEVMAQQLRTERQEVDVTEQSQSETGEIVGVDVETAQIELEVRVGNVEMAVADLSGLRSGQIIDCKRPAGSSVELVVAGSEVGIGELVTVDGRLGVRILKMSAPM